MKGAWRVLWGALLCALPLQAMGAYPAVSASYARSGTSGDWGTAVEFDVTRPDLNSVTLKIVMTGQVWYTGAGTPNFAYYGIMWGQSSTMYSTNPGATFNTSPADFAAVGYSGPTASLSVVQSIMNSITANGYWSWTLDISDSTLAAGGDGTVPGSGTTSGGYTGLTDGDKSWWTGILTPSAVAKDNISAAMDRLKAAGPWGQVTGLIAATQQSTLLGVDLPGTIIFHKYNADGSWAGNMELAAPNTQTVMSDGSGIGPAWSTDSPWFTTQGTEYTSTWGYWRDGVRNLLRGVLWVSFICVFGIWLRGRVQI